MKRALIIGGSGYIGSNLSHFLKSKDIDCVSTWCSNPEDGAIYFDVRKSDISSLNIESFDVVYFFSAIARRFSKGEELALMNEINIDCTSRIIKTISEKKVPVIFLSSDRVYGGEHGPYNEEMDCDPDCHYGQSKAEAESLLSGYCTIVRIPKILSVKEHNRNLLSQWRESYQKGEVINCLTNEMVSVLALEDLLPALYCLGSKIVIGKINLAADGTYSRYSMFEILCTEAGWENKAIKKTLKDLNQSEKNYKDITLENSKMKALGIDIKYDFKSLVRKFLETV